MPVGGLKDEVTILQCWHAKEYVIISSYFAFNRFTVTKLKNLADRHDEINKLGRFRKEFTNHYLFQIKAGLM
jgi:hypothetical protein